MNDVERWLQNIGYIYFLERDTDKYRPEGDRFLNAYVRPAHLHTLLHVLKHDKRFYDDMFYLLHRDVGTHLVSYRSYVAAIDPDDSRCMQIVIDRLTGKSYWDIDRYNTQDLVRIFAHMVFEVLPLPTWMRKNRKGAEDEPIVRASLESVTRTDDLSVDGLSRGTGSNDERTG